MSDTTTVELRVWDEYLLELDALHNSLRTWYHDDEGSALDYEMDLLEIYLHRGWRLKNLTVETLRQSLCFGVSDAQWAASLPTVQANVEFILRHREMVSSEFIHEVITPITMQSLYRLTERSFQVSKLNVAKSKAKRQLRKQRGGAYWASRGFWLCCCSKKPRLN